MPFHFKRKESVTRGVRRLSCERLDDALGLLESGRNFEAVHNVRKEIKKLRSVLRLVRAAIGETAYSNSTRPLRDAADRLHAMRDAQVRLTALKGLSKWANGRIPRQFLPAIHDALRDECGVEEKKLKLTVASAKDLLVKARTEMSLLKVRPNNWNAVGQGIKKFYRRGRKALELAGREPSPEHFHEWRKRVKDLAHHLKLVCPARPRKIKERAEKLDELGNLLGDDHDLFLLREFLAEHPAPATGREAVEKAITVRQKELRAEALKLGSSFYSKKPGRFCRIVGHGWKHWRGNR